MGSSLRPVMRIYILPIPIFCAIDIYNEFMIRTSASRIKTA